MRILVAIITGIILSIWKTLIFFLIIIHWFIVLFSGKRNKSLANFCEIWNTQCYDFLRYISFVTNKRPFPFHHIYPRITKFER